MIAKIFFYGYPTNFIYRRKLNQLRSKFPKTPFELFFIANVKKLQNLNLNTTYTQPCLLVTFIAGP